MKFKLNAVAGLVAFGLALGAPYVMANSSPQTATFQVLMKINKSCTVAAGAGSNIQLGPVAGVDANAAVGTTGTNNFSVTCSNTTVYNMALQSSNNASTAGQGTLKGVAAGNTDTLTYQLHSGSAAGPIWGNSGVTATTVGNGLGGVGNGTAQSIPVYAAVTAAAPSIVTPDNYSDTVTVSVYF